MAVSDDWRGMGAEWPYKFSCDCVIHLAARVHERASRHEQLELYRETNVRGSLRVAEAALRFGATRFIFVSSIKALGDKEPGDCPRAWREDDTPHPSDVYGQSKMEAEALLLQFGRDHGMEVVIVRPPLVYGPGVRANFLQLMRVISWGLPLPLGAIHTRRSVVFVDNLTEVLLHSATHPNAPGKVLHITDGYDPTVAELARVIGSELGRSTRLWSMSSRSLRALGVLTGSAGQIDRLISQLRLNTEATQACIGWTPPYSMQRGIQVTAQWYAGRRP